MLYQKLKTIRPEIWLFTLALLLANWTLTAGRVYGELVFLPNRFFDGDWWRVATFPFVHVSGYHLLLDAGAFLLLYHGLQENSVVRRLVYVAACAGGSLGLSLLSSPLSGGLCGLSGIAHGLMAVTGLELTRANDQNLRRVGWICFSVTALKSLIEMASGRVAFSALHFGAVGAPVAACHLGGVAGGCLAYLLIRSIRREKCVEPLKGGEAF